MTKMKKGPGVGDTETPKDFSSTSTTEESLPPNQPNSPAAKRDSDSFDVWERSSIASAVTTLSTCFGERHPGRKYPLEVLARFGLTEAEAWAVIRRRPKRRKHARIDGDFRHKDGINPAWGKRS